MKNALIIGASQGIGRGVAITLAKKGYHCFLVARTKSKLKEVKKICDKFQTATILNYDIVINSQKIIKELEDSIKSLDFMWLGAANMNLKPIKELSIQEIEKIIRTGFESQVKLVSGLCSLLCKKECLIVSACSDDLWEEEYNLLGPSVYQSVKKALASFGQILHREARKDGLRITNLNLGDTGSFKGFDLEDHEKQISQEGDKLLTVKDVCNVIDFLLSLPPRCNVTDLTILPNY